MNREEKTFPTYLNMGETQGTAAAFFLTNNRAGILISVAIHALFIALFLLQPAARMAAVKTFQISFNEGVGSFKKHATIPDKKGVAAPVTPKEAVTTLPSPVAEKIAAGKPLETTTLPIVANDPADVRSDAFVAGDEHVAPTSPSQTGAAVMETGQTGWATGSGKPSGITSKSGSENDFGNGTSSGTGSGVPLETRFGESNAPSFTHRAMPVYPPLARRRGKEGRVVLTLLIDQTGKVQKIDVTEPADFGLTEAAIEAVRNSTFAPARVNGKKAASRAVLPIRFKLE